MYLSLIQPQTVVCLKSVPEMQICISCPTVCFITSYPCLLNISELFLHPQGTHPTM